MLKSKPKGMKSTVVIALLLMSTGHATAQFHGSHCNVMSVRAAEYIETLDNLEIQRELNIRKNKDSKALYNQRKIEKFKRDRDDLLQVLVQLSTIHKNLCGSLY